jgi:predicted dehydrogenase
LARPHFALRNLLIAKDSLQDRSESGISNSNNVKRRNCGRNFGEEAEGVQEVAMRARRGGRCDGIGAVAVATPNSLHHEVCVAFLGRGIDVICDKPLTMRLTEALDLVERQRRGHGVTHPSVAFAMVRQAREMVRAGKLGRIRQVLVECTQR